MSKKKKNHRNRSGIVYSTNQDFSYQYSEDSENETLPPSEQDLRVMLDRKQRGGKQVTLVTGFVGSDEDLRDLGKQLKSRCGTGGTAKDKEILIQGNWVERIAGILKDEGYGVKISGGY